MIKYLVYWNESDYMEVVVTDDSVSAPIDGIVLSYSSKDDSELIFYYDKETNEWT